MSDPFDYNPSEIKFENDSELFKNSIECYKALQDFERLSLLKNELEKAEKDSDNYTKISIEIKLLELKPLQQKLKNRLFDNVRRGLKSDNFQKKNLPSLYKEWFYKYTKTSTVIVLHNPLSLHAYEASRHKLYRDTLHKERIKILVDLTTAFNRRIEIRQNRLVRTEKLNQIINNYFERFDLNRKQYEEKREKERLQRLMLEDEEGYRKLIDEKKDQRLHHLLGQTDQYLSSLNQLLLDHKNSFTDPGKSETPLDANNITFSKDKQGESYYMLAHAISENITEQPPNLTGGQLKEYQVKGLEWMVSLYNNKLNGILADEMGLGKTIQTISLVAYIKYKQPTLNKPFLIVVPLSTISNWQIEFEKWCPTVNFISYKGSIQHRKSLASRIKCKNFDVLLTTYEYIVRDKSVLSRVKWLYLIIDEGHRMKNRESKITQVISNHYNAPYRLLLTGTPLQNKLPELWGLLNFLLPNIFNCCTTFEKWFNAPFNSSFEKVELNEEEHILIIRRFHKILRPFLLRRIKKDVESQLPGKSEYVIKCVMSPLQKILYKQVEKNRILIGELPTEENKNLKGPKILMNTLMQLRKICNHPFLFPQIEESIYDHNEWRNEALSGQLHRYSGKFDLLDRILLKLKNTKHRVLLFTQMTQVLSILEQYLAHRGIQYLRLDGSTKADDRRHLLKMFNEPNSPYFVFIMSTRAGGLGLNLQTADTVIIFDSDWNPQQDLQAQDRAHRIGQKNEVKIYRFVTINSIEEKILSAAKFKLELDGKIIQAGLFNNSSTEKERKDFLKKLLDEDQNNDEPTKEEELEMMDDEALNQILARSDEEYELFQRMDQERVNNESKVNNSHMGKEDDKNFDRLVTYEELPEWMIKTDYTVEAIRKESLFGSDLEVLGPRSKKALINLTKYLEFEADENIESFIFNDEVGESESRKRKITGDDSFNNVSEEEESLISLPEKSNMSQKRKIMRSILQRICETKDDNDEELFKDFIKLPRKKDCPEYYKIVKQPIYLIKISRKITKNMYNSIDDFKNDLQLLINNSRLFYHDIPMLNKIQLMETMFNLKTNRIILY